MERKPIVIVIVVLVIVIVSIVAVMGYSTSGTRPQTTKTGAPITICATQPFGCDQSTTTMTCFATPTNATTIVTTSNSVATRVITATTSNSTAIYGCTSVTGVLPRE
jgi:flagellar basal body-associated protein FliL